jgi:NADH-quinone oxidoreductase subunit M
MLLGILSIGSYTGTFDLVVLSERQGMIPSDLVVLVFALLLIGFCVKMAIFPLHTWLPDAHAEAPAPISAMLSGSMIKCGAFGMIRILIPMFGPTVFQTSDYLAIIGIITIIYGGLMALAQTDIKRLLAYSSISQMGYIFFGVGISSELGVTGGLFQIITHAVCKSLLFMCAGVILHQTGTRDIRKLGGLAGRMPITTIACFVGALSLAGIPPLSGFWGEWMIFGGGIAVEKTLLTLVAVISSIITAGYYLWFIWRVFFGAMPENLGVVKEGSWQLLAPIVALAVVTVVLGLWPDLLLGLISAA